MCTLGAKKIEDRFFIFKNRDREYSIDTQVIIEDEGVKKLLVVDQKGHCEGLNEYGIGMIEASLRPANKTRFRTISQIARQVLDQKTLDESIAIIQNHKISTNVIISNGERTFIVEKTPEEFSSTEVFERGVIANHGVHISSENGPDLKSVREWTEGRYKRASQLVNGISSFDDIVQFLSDKDGFPNKSILGGNRDEGWWIPTHCSYVYDLRKRTIFFCNDRPDRGEFIEYSL